MVMTMGAEEIVRDRLADFDKAELLESVTLNVSGVALAAAVGMPVIAPVEAFSARPAGSVPLVSAQL